MLDNRRKFRRFYCDTIVEFGPLKKTNGYSVGMTRDFSPAGFRFESQDYDFKLEEDLEFKLKHPQCDLFVSVKGKAVWKETSEFESVTGIELKELDKTSKKRMLEIISVIRFLGPYDQRRKPEEELSQKEYGHMAVPAVATKLAREIIPENSITRLINVIAGFVSNTMRAIKGYRLVSYGSITSFINVISEFISNTIRAKKGYRLVLYGSIALIVILSVGIYDVMITMKPTVPPYDNGIYKTRGSTPTQLDALTGQVEAGTPLEISMHIIDQSKNVYGRVSEVTFRNGSMLQSKNKFKVQFETNKDAYVYILMRDSLNKANLLFPDPETKLDNNIKAITRHTVPKSDHWFRLDDNVGIGDIFALVSERPLENINDLLLEMEEVEDPKKKIMEFAKGNNSAFKTISIRYINDKAFKEITVIKNTEKKVINNGEPGEEHLREMIVRGENGINNILSGNMIPNTVNEGRMQTTLRDMKQNLILEESKRASGITVYRKASPAVVLVVTNDGTGIGSIIDKEGHVLTNWHVVQGHAKVYVLFKPKKDIELKAESAFIASVIKVDEVSDLAYLKIENPPDNLPILKLGNIDDVEVTQDVHTIGHPGEVWTYSKEIVNQIKPNYEWAYYDNNALHESKVIQTQAPVNPGSSGSPLLNDNAEIIGINSFIRKGDGLNFAVSVDVIREFMERRNSRYDRKPPTTPSIEPVSQKPSYYEYDTTGDGIVDVVEIDSESNEIANMYIVDLNQDGIIDHAKLDQYGNGKIDAVVYDTNKDGKYDTWAYDANEDGYMDRWIER